MNPFCDHEAEPRPTIYQPIWESEHSGPTHSPSGGDAHELHDGTACRGAAGHVTMSRIAYFKRKYVNDNAIPLNFRSYRHTVSPLLEEHNRVLHVSLDKMRFIDDPEAFLRRSVLINNLLRRLRAEILLQGAWPFMAGSNPVTLTTTPVTVHQDRSHKRLRLLHEEEEDECVSACCCFCEASRYMQLPVCVYEGDIQGSSLPSSSSVITERLEHFFKEEEEEELETDKGEELDSLCPGLDLCEASFKARERLKERETKGKMIVAVETGQQTALVLAQFETSGRGRVKGGAVKGRDFLH
ncbi:SERTA domain-containing protein 4 [Bagarius yarrelli]|uniref:SERTA domain-containing protein 4 n=1 Tax=Bagarius yarrelli TaxID=175774 RepID=A0A556V4C5_BAGYA|nr:SERTA domain-containing protein 4 [Bagarius yarrelli]